MTDKKEPTHESTPSQQGSSEQTLRAARVAKADKIRARGEDPFTNDIDPASITDLGALRDHYPSARGADDRYDPDKVQTLNASAPWRDSLVVVGRIVAALREALARRGATVPPIIVERVAAIDRGPTGKAPLVRSVSR